MHGPDPYPWINNPAVSERVRRFLLNWLISPWDVGEMLEGEEDAAEIFSELEALNYVAYEGRYAVLSIPPEWR
ncbi:MAG: hypothetical protein H0U76_27175 [Ktedonobacteraceae bacterium]|nr:hypothetical protein [Ktedonobacteraceae bacterium]